MCWWYSRAISRRALSDEHSSYYQQIKAIGNLFIDYRNQGKDGTQQVIAGQNGFFFGNTVIRANPEAAEALAGTYYTFNIDNSGKLGTVKAYNTSETGAGTQDANGNLFLAKTNASYNAAFNGTFPLSEGTWSTISDRATIIAAAITAATPKSAGPLNSIRGLVKYYTNKKVYLPPELPLLDFIGAIGQAQNSDIGTPYPRKYWGLIDNTISVSNGKYRLADTEAGISAASWTTASGS